MSRLDFNLTMDRARRRLESRRESMAIVGRAALVATVFFAVAGAMLELGHPGFVSDRLSWAGVAAVGILALFLSSLGERHRCRPRVRGIFAVGSAGLSGLAAFAFFEPVPRLRLVFAVIVALAVVSSAVALTPTDNK
jgi:hypothetical protein